MIKVRVIITIMLLNISTYCVGAVESEYNLKSFVNGKSVNLQLRNRHIRKSNRKECNEKIFKRFRYCVKNTDSSILNSFTEYSAKLIDGKRLVAVHEIKTPRIFLMYCKVFEKQCNEMSNQMHYIQFRQILKNIMSFTAGDIGSEKNQSESITLKALDLKKQLITHLAKEVNWLEIDKYWAGIEVMIDNEKNAKMYHLVSEDRYILVISHHE